MKVEFILTVNFVCVHSTSLLNESTGSLLDDVQLVNTLQTSKVTASEVSEQLASSEQTEIMINSAREVWCRDEGTWEEHRDGRWEG